MKIIMETFLIKRLMMILKDKGYCDESTVFNFE